MKTYTLRFQQTLPVTIDEAWSFFSSPRNLAKITPDYLQFNILAIDEDRPAYSGQIIRYTVKPLLGISMHWMTEIKNVETHKLFVDEQRIGPYKMWHHQHHFKEVDGGVEMTDIVNYIMPFGILGRIAHTLFVKGQLQEVFDYRQQKMQELFPSS